MCDISIGASYPSISKSGCNCLDRFTNTSEFNNEYSRAARRIVELFREGLGKVSMYLGRLTCSKTSRDALSSSS
jgi:hypothetical protein